MWPIERSAALGEQGGFTLLEVLVSLIITALFLVLLLPATLAGVRRMELSGQRNRALFLAQTELESYLACRSLALGVKRGQEGELSWELDIGEAGASSRLPALQRADMAAAGVVLRHLRLRVLAAGQREPLLEVAADHVYVSQ